MTTRSHKMAPSDEEVDFCRNLAEQGLASLKTRIAPDKTVPVSVHISQPTEIARGTFNGKTVMLIMWRWETEEEYDKTVAPGEGWLRWQLKLVAEKSGIDGSMYDLASSGLNVSFQYGEFRTNQKLFIVML